MDKKKLSEFAEQAELGYKRPDGQYWIDAGFVDIHLERFAELVRQDEREACAKLCEEQMGNTMLLTSYPPKSAAAFQILQLIKARGDKHD